MSDLTEIELNKMQEEILVLCRENLHSVNEDLIKKSFQLSYRAHSNTYRTSGDPYFLHPFEVAKIVAKEISLDDISVISAFLHDVVEDTEIDLNFIKKEFGKEVAEIVDGVTKIGGVFKGHDISQAENYRKLLLSMINDVRVILVKFADRLHNMRTLNFVPVDKQRRIAKETIEIYAPFANRFGLGKVKWELEDLSFKYLNKEAYSELAKKVNDKRREREAYIKKFIKPIAEQLKNHKIEFEIGGRPKHLYSVYRKMIKQNLPFEKIFDLLAIRIILGYNDPNQCYYVLGIINQLYTPIPDRFKDYISIPKKNNYQSIHNTVVSPDGKLVEIQIRTKKMHEIAERGVAAHWKYKENVTSKQNDLEDWVNWVRDIFENASKDEATKEILASFKLNLYQDEIFVFTPRGDLRRLPVGSTPLDFAYDIHSNIGSHCIGAKINGKIVPLDSKLASGDQVEIINSKNQHPNKSWLQFAVTHKAKSNIRKYLNKEEERVVERGKEVWEKKLKKLKLTFNSDELNQLIRKLKYSNFSQFYKAIALDEINPETILNPPVEEVVESQKEIEFDSFANIARSDAGGIIIEGEHKGIPYNYAKCCNPIPGDPIIGYITIGEGIKIHKKVCKNLIVMSHRNEERLVPVHWPQVHGDRFVAGISIRGEDKRGILNDISNSITSYKNTNIKSVNINTQDAFFNGVVMVFVDGIEQLNSLILRIKKLNGIFSVERFDNTL